MTQQQYTSTQPPDSSDALTDAVIGAAKIAGVIAVALVLLPLLVPLFAVAVMGTAIATRTRYWTTARWWPLVVTAGIGVVAAVYAAELVVLVRWITDQRAAAFFGRPADVWLADLWPTFWPYIVGNLALGLLLLPAAFSWQRRRIARQVQARRIPDVVTQERVESARKRAADATTSRQMGVKVRMRTGQIVGRKSNGMTAPFPVAGDQAFGLVNRVTIRTMQDRFRDVRQVRDWIDGRGKYVLMPRTASAVRALLLAESGTGKTVLLNDLILCALAMGWPVFMLDAKGDPADAAQLVAEVRAAGRSAVAGGPWNLFTGRADQVTEKLMRLMPPPDGANQHYLDEIRGALDIVQSHSPIRSITDLQDRLTDPERHVRDGHDLRILGAVVNNRTDQTAGERVYHALSTALRPMGPWLSGDGWSFDSPHADVTVMPLSPVDTMQARLGDLMMLDLRHFMATRLARGDKSPVLVIVDEFPQLVTADSDPGDTASSLLETARSAGVGLILAAQSTAGLSNDETRRARALASGAALIVGRTKDPEDVVKYAGTIMRMEASGAAQGEELRSARAQHSYVIPPQDVREAWDGSFWLIQGGAIAPFRAMPTRTTATVPADTTQCPADTPEEAGSTEPAIHDAGDPDLPLAEQADPLESLPIRPPLPQSTSSAVRPSFTPPQRTPRFRPSDDSTSEPAAHSPS